MLRLSRVAALLAVILLAQGCGGGENRREKTYTGLTVPVFGLTEARLVLMERLQRALRPLGEDFLCVVLPSRDGPFRVYVRPGAEAAARGAIDRVGGRDLTTVITTTRFDSEDGRQRLKQRLRSSSPDGVNVNEEDNRRPECPRISLQIPPGDDASEEALDWAEDVIDEYGYDSVFIERVRDVDD